MIFGPRGVIRSPGKYISVKRKTVRAWKAIRNLDTNVAAWGRTFVFHGGLEQLQPFIELHVLPLNVETDCISQSPLHVLFTETKCTGYLETKVIIHGIR